MKEGREEVEERLSQSEYLLYFEDGATLLGKLPK